MNFINQLNIQVKENIPDIYASHFQNLFIYC